MTVYEMVYEVVNAGAPGDGFEWLGCYADKTNRQRVMVYKTRSSEMMPETPMTPQVGCRTVALCMYYVLFFLFYFFGGGLSSLMEWCTTLSSIYLPSSVGQVLTLFFLCRCKQLVVGTPLACKHQPSPWYSAGEKAPPPRRKKGTLAHRLDRHPPPLAQNATIPTLFVTSCSASGETVRIHTYIHTYCTQVCFDQCNDGTNTHFGTQWGEECWCVDDPNHESITKHGMSENCDYPCDGDENDTCGGVLALDVYEIKFDHV